MSLPIRNIFLSLVLSLILTFFVTVVYVFYPVLWQIAKSVSSPNEGIVAATGGASATVFPIALITASVLFLLIFTLLQKRSKSH